MNKYNTTVEKTIDGQPLFIVTLIGEGEQGKAGNYILLPNGEIAQVLTATGEQTFEIIGTSLTEYLNND